MHQVAIKLPDLRAELARRAWPYWRLAAALEIGPSALSNYVHGHRPMPRDLPSRIEAALQLPPGTLALNTAA